MCNVAKFLDKFAEGCVISQIVENIMNILLESDEFGKMHLNTCKRGPPHCGYAFKTAGTLKSDVKNNISRVNRDRLYHLYVKYWAQLMQSKTIQQGYIDIQ